MGTLRIHHAFASSAENTTRTVRVYTPDAYDHGPHAHFPVVYLNDGQNVFDPPASEADPPWGVNTVLDELVDAGAIEPWIAVAVDHRGVDRIEDDSPWLEPRAHTTRAGGDAYVRFLADDLVPWVDATLRTRAEPHARAIVGSSLGGLVALHAARTRPDVFARVAALSPSVMWAGGATARAWRERDPRGPHRVYLDAGDPEWFDAAGWPLDYAGWTAALYFHLRTLGYGSDALRLVLEPGAIHHESAWRRRLPDAFAWLLR